MIGIIIEENVYNYGWPLRELMLYGQVAKGIKHIWWDQVFDQGFTLLLVDIILWTSSD